MRHRRSHDEQVAQRLAAAAAVRESLLVGILFVFLVFSSSVAKGCCAPARAARKRARQTAET